MHDVIVIGGGVVGSQVACRLAEYGHRVLVLEQRLNLTNPVCCTGIISQDCIKYIGLGSKLKAQPISHFAAFSPAGKSIYLKRREPPAYVTDRASLDQGMDH